MTNNEVAVLVAIAALSLFAASACGGNEALKLNGGIALGMLELQSESGPLIRRLRVNAGVEAGREAHARGYNEERAQAAARAAVESWQCAVDGHRIYSTSVGAFIDALSLWQSGQDFKLSMITPFVARAVDSYRFLVSCLSELGSDALPALPDFFDLIPSSWGLR